MTKLDSYNSLCTRFYDADKPTAPADEMAFYRSLIASCGGPALEPMCGSGRFLVPLLDEGFDVDGFDASPAMLSACKMKLASRGLRDAATLARIEDFVPIRSYTLAFIPSGSLCCIVDDDVLRAALTRLRDALRPGAALVFELDRLPAKHDVDWPESGRSVTRADGTIIAMRSRGRYDARTRRSHSVMRYHLIERNVTVESEEEFFCLRHYDPGDIDPLLREAGFIDVKTHRRFDGPVRDDDSAFMVQCRRREC